MTTATIVIVILTIIGTIVGFYGIWVNMMSKRYKSFQKTMKHKDLCMFYKGEEKHIGTIAALFQEDVVVEDREKNAHAVKRSEIYPL